MSFNPKEPRFIATLVNSIEEGLVLTVGLLSGVAIAGISGTTIVLSGTIFVFTGGVSTAIRHLLAHTHEGTRQESIMIALLYIVAGIVPLLPYMLLDVSGAFTTSIVCSFAAAFIIGLWSGHQGNRVWKSAWHLAFVAVAGSVIGAIAHAAL